MQGPGLYLKELNIFAKAKPLYAHPQQKYLEVIVSDLKRSLSHTKPLLYMPVDTQPHTGGTPTSVADLADIEGKIDANQKLSEWVLTEPAWEADVIRCSPSYTKDGLHARLQKQKVHRPFA